MQEIINKNKCTSCTACATICPKKAITIKEDKDGFTYPVIDQEKCIDCGLCKKTCPVLNTKENKSLAKYYAAYNKNEKARLSSSSGGIFQLIAEEVLKDNGIVIGATFDKDNNLKHIAITKKEELESLKGSKYLQSDLNNIFSFVKDNINDKKILFVGTPCQVAGLKAIIKEHKNLITIDLFCHGVPSTNLFRKYIKELENKNGKLLNYNFRDKKWGWEVYSHTATFKKKKISKIFDRNDYMLLYLSDVALRESCYDCNFKIGNKYSDISLGDFWGVKRYHPDMHNKRGVSAVVINTEKGEDLFNLIKDNIIYKECKLEEIKTDNPQITASTQRPDNRSEFFKEFNELSVKELNKKYGLRIPLKRKIKVNIKRIIKYILGK